MTADGSPVVERPAEIEPQAPKVTILVTTYNKQDFIARTIDSALAQTELSLEVLVVDDASTDETCAVVRSLMQHDRRIRLIALTRNGRQPAALNAGIEAARGDWVAILDGDDWIAEDHCAGLLELAAEHDAAVVASNMQWVHDDGRPVDGCRLLGPGETAPMVLDASGFIRRSMPNQVMPLSFLQPMMRRDLLLRHRVRYHPDDTFDLDFGILVKAILAGGRLAVSPRPSYFYRQVSGSLMSNRRPDALRRMKESNDSLLALCRRYGDARAEALVARRSRAVTREIARAEIAAAVRRRDLVSVALRSLRAPGDFAALVWRRFRWPLFLLRRRLQALLLRTAGRRASALGAMAVPVTARVELELYWLNGQALALL
ncbi:MAG: glycosyltransferase family 2 protein [Alphaproteobacteria bacterium]